MSSKAVSPLIMPLFADTVEPTWRWVRLDQIADVIDCPHSTPVLVEDENAPLIARSQDIRTGTLLVDQSARVSEETYLERIKRAEPQIGDLLYSREGTYFGIAAEVPAKTRVCLGQRMVLIQPQHEVVNHRFLKYWLNSPQVFGHIHGFRDGTVAERLNLPTIRGLAVALPPLSVQKWIGELLYSLDDRITLLRETNATLEAIAQALFKSWFVDFDPVRAKAEGRQPEGMDPATAALFPNSFVGPEGGSVPYGWRIGHVGEIAEVIDCLHSKKPELTQSGYPFLQLSNIRDDGLLDTSEVACISEEDYKKWISRLEATEGDCVITNVGRVGAVAQIPEGFRAAMGRNMTAIRLKEEFPYPTYLIELLQSQWMRAEINSKTDVGTILNALNVRSIPMLRCPIAPEVVSARFEELCRPIRAAMEANLRRASSLAALRDTLLPRLISGQLRLPEAESLLESAL